MGNDAYSVLEWNVDKIIETYDLINVDDGHIGKFTEKGKHLSF